MSQRELRRTVLLVAFIAGVAITVYYTVKGIIKASKWIVNKYKERKAFNKMV